MSQRRTPTHHEQLYQSVSHASAHSRSKHHQVAAAWRVGRSTSATRQAHTSTRAPGDRAMGGTTKTSGPTVLGQVTAVQHGMQGVEPSHNRRHLMLPRQLLLLKSTARAPNDTHITADECWVVTAQPQAAGTSGWQACEGQSRTPPRAVSGLTT